MSPPPPIVVLAGSDRRPVRLPAEGRDQRPLSGYKGADLRIAGRPLVACVVERLRQSGCFGAVYVAGPARVYRGLGLEAEVIDADSSVDANIRLSVETVLSSTPGIDLAFTTCDVLPEVHTLRAVMAAYRSAAPCDVFFPLVRAPDDPSRLGASAWKPTYRVIPAAGEEPVRILPGHLLVGDPEALRLAFLYRLLSLVYRTRNRPIGYRQNVLIRGVLFELLYQDARQLLTLHAPTLTFTVISTAVRAAIGLRDGTITVEELEVAAHRIFVSARHRRRHPARRVALPLIEGLSLALDIDTLEEAEQAGARLDGTGPESR